MKRLLSILVILTLAFGVLGCATAGSQAEIENYDFEQILPFRIEFGSTFAIVSARSGSESFRYSQRVAEYFRAKGYSVSSIEEIQEQFPSYPTTIFSDFFGMRILPADDVARLRIIAERLEVDFVLAVDHETRRNSITVTGRGGIQQTYYYNYLFNAYLFDSDRDDVVGRNLHIEHYESETDRRGNEKTDIESLYEELVANRISQLYSGMISASQ
jgi:hypothetical protein